jgi:hypothetical protein
MRQSTTLQAPYKRPEMSERMKRLLISGNDGTYASDFAFEWAIALSAVNAGKSEGWLLKVLQERGPNYHAILEGKLEEDEFGRIVKKGKFGPQAANRYVSTLYKKAVAYREAHPPWRSKQDVSASLAEHRLWVLSLTVWKGRAGNRNLVVLLAVIEVAIGVGSTVVSFSSRQIAEDVGSAHRTVAKALRELVRDGWLKVEKEGRGTQAPIYRILLGDATRNDGSQSTFGPTKTSLLPWG